MLEVRPNCEHCNKLLSYNSTDAMICSFECTFCKECVDKVLLNVCPNCGGGFQKRPIRTTELLDKYPTKKELILGPINTEKHEEFKSKYIKVKPENR